jgi:hypothetical protein
VADKRGCEVGGYKGTEALCIAWKGYTVIFDDTTAYVLQCPEPHIAFITCGSVAHCTSPTSVSQNSDIITYIPCALLQHMTGTRKWFLASRGVSYMRGEKHNSGHGHAVEYFFMITSLTIFFSLLAIIFFVSFYISIFSPAFSLSALLTHHVIFLRIHKIIRTALR